MVNLKANKQKNKNNISIVLADGKKLIFDKGVTGIEIAKKISKSLEKNP